MVSINNPFGTIAVVNASAFLKFAYRGSRGASQTVPALA